MINMIIIIMLFILGLGCIAGLTVYNITQENKDKQYLESLSDEDREIEKVKADDSELYATATIIYGKPQDTAKK